MQPSRKRQAGTSVWAQEFRLFRAKHFYSQSELAQLLNCAERTVYSIETGQTRNPRFTILRNFRALQRRFEQQRQREAAAAARERLPVQAGA